MTTIPLHPELFTTEPRTILRSQDFEARALRYPSGVASLRLTNSRGLIEVLPFMGQIIWDAQMDGVSLRVDNMFSQPQPAREIIGTYGIVAVVFAGWFAHKHHKRQLAVCALVLLSQFVPVVLAMLFGSGGEAAASGAAAAAPTGAGESMASALPWFVTNVNGWFFTALSAAFTTMILPAAFLGARLADTDLIAHPERHRGLLTVAGIGGLALGALGALHELLVPLTSAQPWAADSALIMVLGLAGGCGWLAVLALYAGGPTSDNRLTGLRRLLSNVGRRSMTAYLSQTVMFAGIFVIAPRLTGRSVSPGAAASAAVAVMVWLTTVVLCAVLERLGMPGPFEVLLRAAVARSERSRTNPFPQQVPAQRAAQLLGQPTSTPVTAGA